MEKLFWEYHHCNGIDEWVDTVSFEYSSKFDFEYNLYELCLKQNIVELFEDYNYDSSMLLGKDGYKFYNLYTLEEYFESYKRESKIK